MRRFVRRLRLARKDLHRSSKVALRHAPFTVRPEQIQIDITDRCNFRCPTCSKWLQRSSEGELKTEQWKSFLTRAAKLPFSGRVVFAGGEPLLRADLVELVHHASGLHLNSVAVSNGSLLNEARLRVLQEAGLDFLMVSLNALDANLHDETRGVTGSYDHLMQVIESYKCLRGSMGLGIASVIMDRNIEHILPMVEFVEEKELHGILFQAHMDDAVHHPFRGGFERFRDTEWHAGNSDAVNNQDQLDALVDALLLRQRQGATVLNPPSQLRAMKGFYRDPAGYHAIPCTAGITNFLVDAYGDVRLCFGFDPVGNILQQDPAGIWKSTEAADLREKISQCRRSCRIMNHVY